MCRRVVESAALLVDDVLPREPLRKWVLSVPFALRFLFASQVAAMGTLRQSGGVLKDLFGEGLHGDSSRVVELYLYF